MFNRYTFSQPKSDGPFRRGLFKYVVLKYLKDSPRHGYEIIRLLAHRFHGLYVPSPGTVYPRLQFLQEQGLVTFVEQEGRKVYSITEEGRKFLIEHQDLEQEIDERLTGWENPENIEAIRKTMFEYNKLGEALSWEMRKLDSNKLKRIREILSEASREIEEIIKE